MTSHGLTAAERFFVKVKKTPVCWLWTAATTDAGYGVFGIHTGRVTTAHRWSFEYHAGMAVPPGYQVDHLCRVRSCVNPQHLQAVTTSENQRRAARAKEILNSRREVIDLDWRGFVDEFRPTMSPRLGRVA